MKCVCRAYSPSGEHPINAVTWYEAAEYCNWLSEQEGIDEREWCYAPDPKKGYAEGMRPRPGFLDKVGYRLPTEAEWEYACRAGASTSRSFGETEDVEQLGQYAWYTKNSQDRHMLPVGSLKPNDFGLFDMLGNALEWAQDPFDYYPRSSNGGPIEDIGDIRIIEDRQIRLLRGGSFINQAMNVRSAHRNRNAAANDNNSVGFRPASTLQQASGPARPEFVGESLPHGACQGAKSRLPSGVDPRAGSAEGSAGPAGLVGRKARTARRASFLLRNSRHAHAF